MMVRTSPQSAQMPATINPVLTEAGLVAALDADFNGIQLGMTHVAFGSGQYTPAVNGEGHATQTAMVDRREKSTFNPGSKTTPLQVTMNTVFPGYVGTPYNVGEIGFWAGDPDAGGILVAIFSAPGYVHAFRNDQLDLAESYSLVLAAVPEGSVSVTVDPLAATAQLFMDDHLAHADPHHQYWTRAEQEAYAAGASQAAPPGMRGEFMRVTAPIGWLIADNKTLGSTGSGANYTGDTYRVLFDLLWQAPGLEIFDSSGVLAVRGASDAADWGVGKRLQLPDERGNFSRGLDNGLGVDPGRELGSTQSDAIGEHDHLNGVAFNMDEMLGGDSSVYGTSTDDVPGSASKGTEVYAAGVAFQGRTSPTGVTETRPRNRAWLVCIKI